MSLRLALVGLGSMGRNHLRAIQKIDGAQLVSVCDPVAIPEGLPESVRAFSSFEALLSETRPDAVGISTPTDTHAALAVRAMEAGVHVLVEKPIAPSLESAQAMLQAAQKHGVRLMVGHVERFNPAAIEARRCLKEGLIGSLWHLAACRLSTYPARIRDVGVVLDLTIHDIDVICDLVGSAPTQVLSVTQGKTPDGHEETLSGIVKFDSGVVATLETSWRASQRKRVLKITGESGELELDFMARSLTLIKDQNREVVPVPSSDALQSEWQDFVDSIRNHRAPKVTGEDGIRALEVAHQLLLRL